ncbi:hypothetical protein ACWCQM_15690 [Streptomyces sp. NPDC002125]
MAGAMGFHSTDPDHGACLCFHLQHGNYDTAEFVEVLEQMKVFYRGERVVLVWDGLSAHWSRPTPGRLLEDQLAEIAPEVTRRGEAAERRRLDELEAAHPKAHPLGSSHGEARVQYAKACRVRHFEAQEAAWCHATRLAEYVSAARTQVETLPPGQARPDQNRSRGMDHPGSSHRRPPRSTEHATPDAGHRRRPLRDSATGTRHTACDRKCSVPENSGGRQSA